MVFEDASGRRRTWASLALGFTVILLTALAGLSLASHRPAPTRTRLVTQVTDSSVVPPSSALATSDAHAARPSPASPSPDYAALLARLDARSAAVAAAVEGPALPLPEGSALVFSVDSPDADASLAAHRDALRAVSPDWLRLPTSGCRVDALAAHGARAALPSGALVLARVANLDGDRWTSAETAALLADDAARGCAARAVAARVVELGADGVNVDLESLAPEDAAGLVSFVAELRAALHPRGLRVTVDVAGEDPAFDLARLGAVADGVVLMAYDEHHPDGPPGPIASHDFVARQVAAARALVPADRLVVGIGAYCVDWSAPRPDGRREVDSAGVIEALGRASALGVTPVFAPGTANLHFDYRAPSGEAHAVWCLDAVAAADAVAIAAAHGVTRTALWRAGTEDPSVWSVLAARDPAARARALARVDAPADAVVEGVGEVISPVSPARAGRRAVALDPSGRVLSARYDAVPAPARLARLGSPDAPGVVLTFDDGPDPRWTAAVLDALRDLRAPATFFVVGSAAEAHPGLVERARREGHLVASHSFTHPHMDALPAAEARAELDRTAHALEGLAGHEVLLYRAPYSAFVNSRAELAAQRLAFEAGYTYVAASVDPDDWASRDAASIAEAVFAEVVAGGRVVVLHDGGGDRAATVGALRRLVPRLRAAGHPVVSLASYLGLAEARLRPPLPRGRRLAARVDAAAVRARGWGAAGLAALFAACTALAALRVLGLGALVAREALRPAPTTPAPNYEPPVTVLVPAFNEATVIVASVRALLAGEYTNLEVLVVDDGSTDGTADLVDALALDEPRVRCLRKANGGKASAANLGIEHALGDIIVAVDADTVIAPQAIRRMVAHFADRRVTAVCGNVEVGNVNSLLTAFQAIEYVTSQNFDRRAFQALNCIGVVPGALGAWRRDAVLAVEGYSGDTLVEDADLTLCVLRAGGVIAYEPGAVARTEAPESLGALWKQRFRWTYGTYQCLAKHRGSLFRGTLGWVALPNAIVFQVLFPLVSPIGDLALVGSLVTRQTGAVLSGYLGFLAMDLVASTLAFALDRKPMRWLPLLVVQRFTYRQFLYLVSLRAMVAVLAGRRHGWRKLARTGTVIAPLGRATPVPPRMPIGASTRPSYMPPAM